MSSIADDGGISIPEDLQDAAEFVLRQRVYPPISPGEKITVTGAPMIIVPPSVYQGSPQYGGAGALLNQFQESLNRMFAKTS